MSYKIRIKTLNGDVLTFRGVEFYDLEEGMIIFTDKRTSKIKRFSISNSEVEDE